MYRFLVGKCAHVVSALHVYVDLRVKHGAETTFVTTRYRITDKHPHSCSLAASVYAVGSLAGYFSITTALP